MVGHLHQSVTEQHLYAVLLDGREVFGVHAFPFRRDMQDVVAYSLGGKRQVLTEAECRVLRVLSPESVPTLPDGALWEAANDDPTIRTAIKERCSL